MGMYYCIKKSTSKRSAPGSAIGRSWDGEGCSTRLPKSTQEGNKAFRKESHGPGHSQGWEPPTPGGGRPWARGPRTYFYVPVSSIAGPPPDIWYNPPIGKQGLTCRLLSFLKEIKRNQRKDNHGSFHVPVCCMSALRGAAKCSILLQAQDEC